jgi:putative endonuclease
LFNILFEIGINGRPGLVRNCAPQPITTAVRILARSCEFMSAAGTYYVYMPASGRHGTPYIGVANNVHARLEQHRNGRGSEFVRQYKVYSLVHVEAFASAREAIAREKQLKNWHRDWKIRLIEENNLDWSDLSHLL